MRSEDPAAQGRDLEAVTAALAVLPFHTGSNKTHPVLGVESIFAEFAAGKWIIPCEEPQPGRYTTAETVNEWLAECENYDPDRHTGDHLMASWFAREGGRMNRASSDEGGGGAIVIGDEDDAITPERAAVLEGWESLLKKRPEE